MLEGVQKIASFPIGTQFVTSSLCQCLLVVYVVEGSLNTVQFIMFALQYVCIIIELLSPCFFGNRLIEAGEELQRAVYECNWCEQSLKFQQLLVIFLARTQKYNGLKAGNWIQVDLRNFMHAQKLVYSFFTYLNSFK